MTSRLDPATDASGPNFDAARTVPDVTTRLIDTWFPCPEVDAAVRTPSGSGRSEKALFTWFASRPIAQARAAVLCSLLPDTAENRTDIKAAVLSGDRATMRRLTTRIAEQYGSKPPVVLDMFSGRGIIPLEAARVGASAIGTDLSPVATLASRLLAEYPLRDWSAEPPLPYARANNLGDEEEDAALSRKRRSRRTSASAVPTLEGMDGVAEGPRLLVDVGTVLAEVGRGLPSRSRACIRATQTVVGGFHGPICGPSPSPATAARGPFPCLGPWCSGIHISALRMRASR